MEHYRCHKAAIPNTRAEPLSDTVEPPPQNKIHMLQMSSVDATYHAAQDLIYELQNPEPASPLLKLGNGQKESLKTLANIFRKANPPALPP